MHKARHHSVNNERTGGVTTGYRSRKGRVFQLMPTETVFCRAKSLQAPETAQNVLGSVSLLN